MIGDRKTLRRAGALGLGLVALLCLASCGGSGGGGGSSLSYTDLQSGSGSLYVTNNRTEALVLFKDSIAEGSAVKNGALLQVVPSGALNFRVAAPEGCYILRVARFTDPAGSAFDFAGAEEICSRLVLIDSSDTYIAFAATGSGNARLEVTNSTDFYVEIHVGSFEGGILGTVPPNAQTMLYLEAGSYNLYPVSIMMQYSGDEVVGVYKQKLNEAADAKQVSEGLATSYVISASISPIHVSAYLKIQNDYAKGLKLYSGDTLLQSLVGHETINAGSTEIYALSVEESTGIRTYAALVLRATDASAIALPSLEASRGYMDGFSIDASRKSTAVERIDMTLMWPTRIAAASASNNGISLSWNSVSGATGYAVYRDASLASESDSPIATVATTSFSDSGLLKGTTYYYRIASHDEGRSSWPSPVVSATTSSIDPPAKLAKPTLSAFAEDQLSLAWSSSAAATSYRLYRDSALAGTYSTIAYEGSETFYLDGGLDSGTTYYYRVAAGNAGGYGEKSDALSATTVAVLPDLRPASVSVTTDLYQGRSAMAKVVVANDSKKAVSTPFTVGLYLRAGNKTVYYDEYLRATAQVASIAANGNVELDIAFDIPADFPIGSDAYLGAFVDTDLAVAESDENDNYGGYVVSGSTSYFSVGLALAKVQIKEYKPNLVATSFTAASEYWIGNSYSVDVDVANTGTAAAGSFNVGIYLREGSTNVYSTSGTRIGYASIPGLEAGASASRTIAITIPAASAYTSAGYIGVWVDDGCSVVEQSIDAIGEGDWNMGGWNGSSFATGDLLKGVTLHENRPDIAFVEFNPPTALTRGQSYELPVTITNSGPASTGAGFTLSAFLRSGSTTVYYSAYLIGSLETAVLGSGESRVLSIPITVPSGFTAGSENYVGIWLDSGGIIAELCEEKKTCDGSYNQGGWNGSSYSAAVTGLKKVTIY